MPHGITAQIQFKALFEHATEAIIVADQTGVIQLANPASERIFEYEEGELTSQKVEVLIPGRFAKHHAPLRDGFAEQPRARSMGHGRDLFAKTRTGREFPVEISLSPFVTPSGNFTIAFIIDISTRKKNEEAIASQQRELENLARELEKRVKDRTMILEEALQQLEISRNELNEAVHKEKELNEMKTRFVSMASYEIRTPLTTILSSLSLLEKYSEAGNKDKQRHHIDRIKLSISNMTDLLDDVLSISKLEEGKILVIPEEIQVPQYITGLIKELNEAAGESELIRYMYAGHTGIFFDKKILRIILFNLVTNALKFSMQKSVVLVHTVVTNESFSLSVKDKGIGIAEEDKVNLFERFFRGQNATNIPGTGLGLNIVSRYVELLGGNISVKSKLCEGSTFTIIIPKKTDAKESIAD